MIELKPNNQCPDWGPFTDPKAHQLRKGAQKTLEKRP